MVTGEEERAWGPPHGDGMSMTTHKSRSLTDTLMVMA